MRERVALCVGQRTQPHQLDRAPQRRPALKNRRQRRGRRLAHDHDPARGDGWQHLIEKARGLGNVCTAGGELQEIRNVPEHALLGGELRGQPAHPLLELSEVLLPRHQVGRTGLEDGPSMGGRARREQQQEARLAHPRLADDERRAEGLVQKERLCGCEMLFDRLVLDEQLLFGVAFHDAAERLQELAIQRLPAPRRQLRQQRLRRRMRDPAEQGLGRRNVRGRSVRQRRSEVRGVAHFGAGREVLGEKRGNQRMRDPILLTVQHEQPERRPLGEPCEVLERVEHRPWWQVPEMTRHERGGGGAVGALAERCTGDRRRHPVGPSRVVHDYAQGRVGRGEERDRLTECLVRGKVTGMRTGLADSAERRAQRVKPGGGIRHRRRRLVSLSAPHPGQEGEHGYADGDRDEQLRHNEGACDRKMRRVIASLPARDRQSSPRRSCLPCPNTPRPSGRRTKDATGRLHR